MRKFKFSTVLVAAVFATATLVGISNSSAANPNCNLVDGDYIVSFKANANVPNELKLAPGKAVAPVFTYDTVINGFAANLSAEQACAFQKRPNIMAIELDLVAKNQVSQPLTIDSNGSMWNLDRIDAVTSPDDSTYSYTSDGTGSTVYIVDTGINSKHVDFSGRLRPGFSSIKGSKSTEDCNGHGTHVAGSAAGTLYGLAKKALIVPIRVLNCQGSGTYSGIISGLNWIAKNAPKNSKTVANMSLGGGFSSTLNTAVTNLINSGVQVVVAAGNEATNACTKSPASTPAAITVAASGRSNNFSSYSNYGNCVDIIAPGDGIKSNWIGTSTTATNTISGTSMAAPHVAGGIARYLGVGKSVAELMSNSNKISISGIPGTGTPNQFLYLDPTK